MRLRLRYAPEPVNAGSFAADIVASAAEVSGVELDFTPDSLRHVDRILQGFRDDGIAGDQVAETLFGFPLLVAFANGQVCNPIGKAFMRMDNGPEDSIRYFYSAFAGEAPTIEG